MAGTGEPVVRRERWGTRIGVILAVAGSAVGLGNFLRFPGVAVQNGGGAFMIPYFLALVLLGIPICWAEWIMGRRAGRMSGLSSAPGLFGVLTRGGPLRYVGALGLFIPVVIYMWYVYVESWCLAYAYYTFTGDACLGIGGDYTGFLDQFTGKAVGEFFGSQAANYTFFIITFIFNFYLIYRGLSKGIEKFCLVAMPLLILLAIIIVGRVLTLGTPDPAYPDQSLVNGLGYMWNPDWSQLRDPQVWLSACGQIFFSLSVGFGIVMTYSSYLRKSDDVVLSGLTASATNEFCEVCLGGLIVIPAAFIFLGISQMESVANAGTFDLGFVTVPNIFAHMVGGPVFQGMFYFLLFLAGATSSLSMLQPAIAFFEEGFNMSRKVSVTILAMLTFLGANTVVLTQGMTFEPAEAAVEVAASQPSVLGTLDGYAGDLGIPLLAMAELLLFIFVIKVPTGIKEGGYGANMKLPFWFGFVITFISPVFLFLILAAWFLKKSIPFFIDTGFGDVLYGVFSFLFEERPVWVAPHPVDQITMWGMIIFFFFLCILVKLAWPNMQRHAKTYSLNGSED